MKRHRERPSLYKARSEVWVSSLPDLCQKEPLMLTPWLLFSLPKYISVLQPPGLPHCFGNPSELTHLLCYILHSCLCMSTSHLSSPPQKSTFTIGSLVSPKTFGMIQENKEKSYHRTFRRLLLCLVLRRWNLQMRCLLSDQKRKQP